MSLASDRSRSRTSPGRFTSLGPFGTMYASSNLRQSICTYSLAGATFSGSMLLNDDAGSAGMTSSYCRWYREASMVNSNVSRQWFWDRNAMNALSVQGGGA